MLPFRLAARATLATALLSAPGCSLALKTDEAQCVEDRDCAARGEAFAGTICVDSTCQPKPDPKWGCIGEPQEPPGTEKVTITLQFIDLISESPVPDVAVKLCSQYDPPCDMPLGTFTSGADGQVTSSIAADFLGFLDIQKTGYYPAVLIADVIAAPKNNDIQLISLGAAGALSAQAGVPIDPDKGIVIARAVDCQQDRTAGASFSISPSTGETRFYVVNNVVTQNATETDKSGNAGFVNVDVGTPTIIGTIAATGEEFGKLTTLVRAGTVSYQAIRPFPPE